jgi:D-alanine-D-alanine ligase
MSKKRVAVIFGGVSSEHEVSLKSAASVLRNMPPDRFEPIQLGITKDGRWYQYFGDPDRIEDGSWITDTENLIPAFVSPDRGVHGILRGADDDDFEVERIDAVFPVLHGRNGEDGAIQGLFELAGIPYAGCPVLASAVCMDKAVTNTILDHCGIKRAPWSLIMRQELGCFEERAAGWEAALGYPMFVKPANAGSSVGITKARDIAELRRALDLAFQHDEKAVVEKTIEGRELECAVLGNLDPIASVVGEILPEGEFYDYDAKYNSASVNTSPRASLTPQQQAYIQKTAVEAFLLLGCRGMARVDFLLESETGEIYLNELNTIPGFTAISMYSKMLAESGIPYPELIGRLIDLALERSGQPSAGPR